MKHKISENDFDMFYKNNEIISMKAYKEIIKDIEKEGRILVGLSINGDKTVFKTKKI